MTKRIHGSDKEISMGVTNYQTVVKFHEIIHEATNWIAASSHQIAAAKT